MIKIMTVAFAGPGMASEELVKAELGDFLPVDADISVIFPARVPRTHKGLLNVRKWVTAEFGTEADGGDAGYTTAEHGDLIRALRAGSGEQLLVVLWGDSGDMDTAGLIEDAAAAGIPCKDLTAGLDDIAWGPPAVKHHVDGPESHTEPRTRRTRTKTRVQGSGESPAVSEPRVDKTSGEPGREPDPAWQDRPRTWSGRELAEILDDHMAGILADIVVLLGDRDTGETHRETHAYLKSADGTYRKRGRGRPRNGEEPVELTTAEVGDLLSRGLITS
jgi:hypothetical protein